MMEYIKEILIVLGFGVLLSVVRYFIPDEYLLAALIGFILLLVIVISVLYVFVYFLQ
jgi:hypothetical protein